MRSLSFPDISCYLQMREGEPLRKSDIGAVVLGAGLVLTGLTAASAQTTFQRYRCGDGTQFIVGFYPYDDRAHMQIDGREVTLLKRLALSGARYAGAGVALRIGKTGITIKHARRPATACELS
jgi:membrane-bound inhibitor of C-type lysozyme